MTGPLVDACGLVRDWANTLTGTLVGAGRPVTNGFHLANRDSPAHATYGVLSDLTQGTDGTGVLAAATVSASIWGPTKQAAQAAAVAFANACLGLSAAPYTGAAGTLLAAGPVSLIESPDRGRARYIVDAQFIIAAA